MRQMQTRMKISKLETHYMEETKEEVVWREEKKVDERKGKG